DLHNDIAGIYQSLGRFDQAVTHCRSALALSASSAAVRLNLARALYAQGDLTESISQYRELLRSPPESAECHFNLALVLCALGDAMAMTGALTQAIEVVQRAATLQSDLASAHANLAYLKRQACDWTDFDRDAARVLALLRQGARDVPPFVMLMLPAKPADRL